ncbi:hypothetical protein [Pseudomonas frederiksbergensis]|uniref:hypothetical protein n=1 Tax=Pseudomonas frederiksbergensis TaxID=104087 RepID=UPI001F29A5F4|nr:hypothetical protein [Pseudomonas frederiksbergensis]
MQITYSHIKKIKRVAKELKHTHPSLKLGQRQDIAAVQELGVRNYYEASRLYDRWLMEHVHTPPGGTGVSKCSFCEFSFSADLKQDRDLHREIHERYHEVSEALGYVPAGLMDRERMKRNAFYRRPGNKARRAATGTAWLVRPIALKRDLRRILAQTSDLRRLRVYDPGHALRQL